MNYWRKEMKTGLFRFLVNIWPPYLGAGIKVIKLSNDFRYVEVQMKQHWYNTNYVGTHFGGSMYAMTDPFYMVILIKALGQNYIVWDKGAAINFKKPGRGKLRASFSFTDDEIKDIRAKADSMQKYVFDKLVDIYNSDNEVVATVTKTLYVRKK